MDDTEQIRRMFPEKCWSKRAISIDFPVERHRCIWEGQRDRVWIRQEDWSKGPWGLVGKSQSYDLCMDTNNCFPSTQTIKAIFGVFTVHKQACSRKDPMTLGKKRSWLAYLSISGKIAFQGSAWSSSYVSIETVWEMLIPDLLSRSQCARDKPTPCSELRSSEWYSRVWHFDYYYQSFERIAR